MQARYQLLIRNFTHGDRDTRLVRSLQCKQRRQP
ncbi:hypothetical protein L683_26680 [Pseudomonas aeruginosa WC55]|jgi:hypothetical protein|nr:hypothetical protein L683_26680 [Pseudomonas aeruginosa WC55]